MKTILLAGLLVLFSLAINAQNWTTAGNAGTDTTNFLGTTDDKPLVIKVNNVTAGKVASNGFVSLGYQAGRVNGHATNTAIGHQAFYNITGGGADWSTAVGYQAGVSTTTGWGNTYLGFRTGYSNSTSNLNTGVGTYALNATTSASNTALGAYSFHRLTTGDGNVAVGYLAGAGEYGSPEHFSSVLDNKCVFLGTFASRDSAVSNTNALTNAIAIGYKARVGASNSLALGGTGIYAVNVGIGNTAPQNKLEITQGTDGYSGLRFTNLTSSSSPGTASGKVLSVNSNGDVVLETAATGSTTITAGANITVTGSSTTGYTISSTAAGPSYWDTASVGSGNIINNNAGGVVIGAGLTTLPSGYKLYVANGILTEKVKVALSSSSNWADYVFAKNYTLKPLAEVENFINKNQHLPGMPSAKTLVKEGIDVTEMMAKQMEKIEELTLYLIDMNKKLEKLEKENAALKTSLRNQQ